MWHAWERREKCTRFWWESPKERDHWEDQGVGGKMVIRMDLREIGLGGVDWIRLSEDRDRWRAVVSAVMNLRVLAPRSYTVCARTGRHCQFYYFYGAIFDTTHRENLPPGVESYSCDRQPASDSHAEFIIARTVSSQSLFSFQPAVHLLLMSSSARLNSFLWVVPCSTLL
jgi:hypothetical protein